MINRDAALEKLKSYQPDSYQYQHALYSEAIMRAMAPRFDADPDAWGLCGLLHDVDFPLTKSTPEQHGLKAKELLEGFEGVDSEIMHAIMAHNSEYTGVEPSSNLDYALRCAETVTGMISAAALMRPTGMEGMEPKSIKKKMKDKAFAAAVNRDNIRECEKIGLPLDEFLAIAIKAMS
ncbi:HD domain-containing protein [Desulfovibrio sp. OttesenSCG-928-C06]|nr:HD domain-containing protein [Desulfovibrio sp. OttesenSCG-928-C06]